MTTWRHDTTGRRAPGLLFAGAGILLYRTIALVAGGARRVLKPWVVGLTYLETAIDVVTMGAAVRWWRSRNPEHAHPALVAGACATLLHAVRVAVFVIGRTGPWVDFDVRKEARADHDERWTWAQVVFAGVLSISGVVGVIAIWIVRRRRSAGGSAEPATTTS